MMAVGAGVPGINCSAPAGVAVILAKDRDRRLLQPGFCHIPEAKQPLLQPALCFIVDDTRDGQL